VGGFERVGLGTIFELWGGHRCLNVIKVRTFYVLCFVSVLCCDTDNAAVTNSFPSSLYNT
jgi:hypothetical protein